MKEEKNRIWNERDRTPDFLKYAVITLFLTLAVGAATVENAYKANAGAMPLSIKQPLIILSLIISTVLPYLVVKKQIKDDARRREDREKEDKENKNNKEEKQPERKESEWPELLRYNTAEKIIDYFQKNHLMLALAILALIVLISIIVV